MPDIEIKRGYEVLPDNNVRFGIRVINNSNSAILDVEVILDYNESLFNLEGHKIQKLSTIPPTVPRTAKFILKPLGCIHKENIGATVLYKDHQWKKHTEEMRPKEVHCVCPFLKEKSITRAEFLRLSNSGYLAERGVNFEGIDVDKLLDFLSHTCKNRLYKVDEIPIENGMILYLAGDALGEKAHYLLTAVVKEYEGLTQVLLRANSDKNYGLNGFLNEILDNLRHLVISASAREIGIIRKEQVINIIDSVVQRTTFAGGEGAAQVNIRGSVVQRTEIKGDEEKKKREEERRRKELEERVMQGDKRKVRVEEKAAPNAEDFENVISQIFSENEKKGESFVEISAGDLHRQVGGYPGYNHRMPICCSVMRRMMRIDDAILSEPPSGQGASLYIRYYLPRTHFEKQRTNIEQESGKKQREKEEDRRKREEIPKTYTNSIGMEFKLIPAGEFMMGSEEYADEKPVHRVKISKPFYLGTYPVTQKEWKSVMGNNPSTFKADDTLPVEAISWNDVQEFIKELNKKEGTDKYRLPSEAEWEYAACAGTTTRYSYGDDESKLGDYAWYCENSGSRPPKKGDYFGYNKDDWFNNKWNGKTHYVGKKKPNPWGLYDMHGNVWEWVQDMWHYDYNGAPTDGSSWEGGDGSSRASRGGSWSCLVRACRSAVRNEYRPGALDRVLGFRLLRVS